MLQTGTWALRADRVGKVYHVIPRLRPLLTGQPSGAADPGRVTALSEVSLMVGQGEAVAVIGANGAGKSTFLRILAGLSRPTSGSVECRARLATLLELGAGLVEDWSGESNARSALSLQGSSPDRLAVVERFAEIGSFFSRPVRTYSSGMRLRLAYALAIGLEPEILIADEIVAVGDESFQRRCALELQRFLAGGGTLVLATHNLYLAEKLCQRALWLERGVTRESGATHDVTQAYRDAIRRSRRKDAAGHTAVEPAPAPGLELSVRVLGTDGHPVPNVVSTGSPWQVEIEGAGQVEHLRIDIRRIDGTLVTRLEARSSAVIVLPPCPLLPGRYVMELSRIGAEGNPSDVRVRHELLVRGARRELGNVVLEHEWA